MYGMYPDYQAQPMYAQPPMKQQPMYAQPPIQQQPIVVQAPAATTPQSSVIVVNSGQKMSIEEKRFCGWKSWCICCFLWPIGGFFVVCCPVDTRKSTTYH
jgi:hypothetical protein